MSSNSTDSPRSRKGKRPPKPDGFDNFPLYPHPLGYWAKKINGTLRYFGRWGRIVKGEMVWVAEDGAWLQALKLYNAQKDDLHAGRMPRVRVTKTGEVEDDAFRVKHLCNAFLTAKHRKLESGELGVRMFQEYRETTNLLVTAFGKEGDRPVDDLDASDFEKLRATLAERFGPVRLGNAITRIKSVFKYGLDNGLLDKAVRFGSEFKKPGKAVMRKHKADGGGNMLEADEIRKLLSAADPATKAMILLGVNCGFGPTDCATLPMDAADLDAGWIDFPRPKTGIARRCPLWPETVQALKDALSVRPAPSDPANGKFVFITLRGRPFIGSSDAAQPITKKTISLMKECKVHKPGRGPYTMRHAFRTVADEALDRVAIDLIMGHSDPSMGGHYRERIDDARLVRVAEHVRQWLFGKNTDGENADGDAAADGAAPAATEAAPERETPRLRLYAG